LSVGLQKHLRKESGKNKGGATAEKCPDFEKWDKRTAKLQVEQSKGSNKANWVKGKPEGKKKITTHPLTRGCKRRKRKLLSKKGTKKMQNNRRLPPIHKTETTGRAGRFSHQRGPGPGLRKGSGRFQTLPNTYGPATKAGKPGGNPGSKSRSLEKNFSQRQKETVNKTRRRNRASRQPPPSPAQVKKGGKVVVRSKL